MSKPVILTGIRANNDLHIGNYFGAILPMIDMAKSRSDEYQINLFIPDLHSFTTPIDHSKLQSQILHNAGLFVAAGLPIDNESINLYRQSYVPAHSELTVILNSFTGFGQMERMTQFKDKSGIRNFEEQDEKIEKEFKRLMKSIGSYDPKTGKEKLIIDEVVKKPEAADLIQILVQAMGIRDERIISVGNTMVGLFDYPVLMASDILLYNAEYVPVGDDQSQHLEFTRDIAERMNKKFGDIFTVPEAVKDQHAFFGKDQGLRIKDLVDPTKKMSKSDDLGKGVIFLGDSPEVAAKKVMSATTDDKAKIHYDTAEQPGISNLLQLLSLFQGSTLESVVAEYEGQTSYGEFKKVVAGAVSDFLTDFQSKLSQVDDNAVLAKMEQSENAMRLVANATLLRAQQAVGLRPKDN